MLTTRITSTRLLETTGSNLRATARLHEVGYENKISDKFKVLTPSVDNIFIQREHIETVNNFAYLGSSIPNFNKDI